MAALHLVNDHRRVLTAKQSTHVERVLGVSHIYIRDILESVIVHLHLVQQVRI